MTAAPSRRPAAFVAGLLLAYVGLVVYASLAPFGPWLPWADFDGRFLLAPRPRHFSLIDLLLNVAAYLPLGFLLGALLARQFNGALPLLLATLAGAGLSLGMEVLQALLPPRIADNFDIVTNAVGALLGALPWLMPGRLARWLAPVERWRALLLRDGVGAEFGASLLLLWCACNLNPSIPFLGAGVLVDPDRQPWYQHGDDQAMWALQACAAGLNAGGLGLFLGVLLRPTVHRLTASLVSLVTLLGVKATAAEFLLKPEVAQAWFDSATLAGLGAGTLTLVALHRLRGRHRARLAAVCLLAGGLLAKLDGHYASWFVLRGLFGLNLMQLSTFADLTEWINEVWPLAALLFLAFWRPPRALPTPAPRVPAAPAM